MTETEIHPESWFFAFFPDHFLISLFDHVFNFVNGDKTASKTYLADILIECVDTLQDNNIFVLYGRYQVLHLIS